MKQLQSYFLAFLLLVLLRPNLTAQQHRLQIDTVLMNPATQTVDIYLHALLEGEAFFKFGEAGNDLIVTETLLPSGNAKAFEDVKYWSLVDSARFGERRVIQILTQSTVNTHKERREYQIRWTKDGQILAEDSYIQPWQAKGIDLRTSYSFWDLLALGAFIAALALLVLSEFIPMFRKARFKRKYVKPYGLVKSDGEQDKNPITGKLIQREDLVVKMCERPYCRVPLEVWQKRAYRCSHYPENCDGNPKIGSRQFFKQIGIFRQLNWLWFGITGGLLGWAASYLLEQAPQEGDPFWQNVMLGLGLGFGLTLMLSWEAERDIWVELSPVWIAVRTASGALAAGIIFGFGYYLEKWIGFNWVAGPLTWLLFSAALGAILSIKSNILLTRGLISGLIAGGVSALLYGGFLILLDEAQLARLLAFTILGGILGYGIIQVVTQLEEVKMEVLSPAYRSGLVFELDKHLKAGQEVVIGKHMKNTVRVKWEDEFAQQLHARLKMNNQSVVIQPLPEAELWINDEPLSGGNSRVLKGGEQIKFARNSPTVLLYHQKGQLS